MPALLEVADLHVRFGDVHALRGVSISLKAGDSLAIVGETGAGKSTLAHCLVGLIQPPVARGRVWIDDHELLGASEEMLRSIRWEKVAIAMQNAPFNPVVSVREQIAEPLRRWGLTSPRISRRIDALAEDALLDPSLLNRFAHQLTGGQRRKAMLAMSLALDPQLLILDEPTAGLDAAAEDLLLDRLTELQRERGFALVMISHNLAAAARLAERTLILYAGEPMESGSTRSVLEEPAHPYTWALINATPTLATSKELRPIRGTPPDPRSIPPGCPFHPRCTQAEEICWTEHPDLEASRGRDVACHFGGLKTLLSAASLDKVFSHEGGHIHALHDVSISLMEGESVGVVGPSGGGKTTLARILCGDLTPDGGEVLLEGQPIPTSWHSGDRSRRRRIQLIAQDPWDAFSPRLRVTELVREPLDIAGNGAGSDEQIHEVLEAVGLPSSGSFLDAHVHQLSGGQLQRLALARALVAAPKVLVADEPTSMLDSSEQARLLVVLREVQVERGLGLILLSHDISVVRRTSDRIVVLDEGTVVEEGRSDAIFASPQSTTMQRMLAGAERLTRESAPGRPEQPVAG